MFVEWHEYTRNEIHAQVGGNKQTYLPSKDGVVVAACLTKSLNPQAPKVILCGRGVLIAAAGERLATQGSAIPVFVKAGTNRWTFHGRFNVVAFFESGPEFDRLISGSGREPSDVSRAIVMENTDR